jgi:hypothetical protein
MAGYTREFLIDAFVSRYECLGPELAQKQRVLAEKTWDLMSKEKFRQYCSLDAEAIKLYKQSKH